MLLENKTTGKSYRMTISDYNKMPPDLQAKFKVLVADDTNIEQEQTVQSNVQPSNEENQ